MQIRVMLSAIAIVILCSNTAFAQNWSFDARVIALGGVDSSGNLSTKTIEEQKPYTSIVLPIGLIQILRDRDRFDPNSPKFDPVRDIEYGVTPFHYVIGRDTPSAGETTFITDIRNANLSR